MKTILNGVDTEKFHPADPTVPYPPVINFHSRLIRQRSRCPATGRDCGAAVTNRFSIQLVGRKFHHQAPPDDFDRLLEKLPASLSIWA